jgi:hypothetical protein
VTGVLLVVGLLVVLVLIGVIPFLTPPPGKQCTALECGGAIFVLGTPVAGTCPAGGNFGTTGCAAGDFVYALTIEESNNEFGVFSFEILDSSGAVLVVTGGDPGFSIINHTGVVSADYLASGGVLNMTSGWIYSSGISASTPLSNLYSVRVDMGFANPHGMGDTFSARSTAGGGLARLALP